MSEEPKKRVYDIHEVAQILGIHYDTARDLVNSGQIKSILVGKRKRVTQQALDEFLRGAKPSDSKE